MSQPKAGQRGKILVDDVEETPGRENGAEYLEGPEVHALPSMIRGEQ